MCFIFHKFINVRNRGQNREEENNNVRKLFIFFEETFNDPK